jgi:hypothetical protein
MASVTLSNQELYASSTLEKESAAFVSRFQIWWNSAYSCRRNITIEATPDGLPIYHPVTAFVPRDIFTNGKLQADQRDLEVLYLVSEVPDVWRQIPRTIERVSNYYRVRFLLQEALGADELTSKYFIFYSNPFKTTDYLMGNPYSSSISELDWPLEVTFSSRAVSYTRPGEHWNNGYSEIANAKATFQFYGPQVAVYMAKGPKYGIVEVQVDSGPWERVDLFSSTEVDSSLVYTGTQLGDGIHECRLRVLGQKNSSSSSIAVQLKSFKYKKHSVAKDIKEEHYEGYGWHGGISGE